MIRSHTKKIENGIEECEYAVVSQRAGLEQRDHTTRYERQRHPKVEIADPSRQRRWRARILQNRPSQARILHRERDERHDQKHPPEVMQGLRGFRRPLRPKRRHREHDQRDE